VPDAGVPTALKHVDEPGDVAVDIGLWVVQRVAHPRLGGQVDDPIKALALEQRPHGRRIGQIQPLKPETAGPVALVGHQARQACLFKADIVVIVEVVEPHHGIAAGKELFAGVIADESRGAGDKNLHGRNDTR